MKKAKDTTNHLFDFNQYDEEEKKKKKSNKARIINKTKKTKKTSRTTSSNKEPENTGKKRNAFDFNNEIVIGLKRLDDEPDIKTKTNKDGKTKRDKEKRRKEKEKEKQRLEKEKLKAKKKKEQLKKSKKTKQDKIRKNNKIGKNSKSRLNKKLNNKDEVSIGSTAGGDIILETKAPKEKKPKKNLKVLKYTFLVICIIGVTIAIMMSPLFNIKEISTEGNDKITEEELISTSGINIGENTYRTSFSKAKKNILENPYVKEVKIKRVLPDKVVISVEERKATFMIEFGTGYAYINNQGYVLEISDSKLEIPILQGTETPTEDFIPGKRLCVNDLQKLSTVIKIMEVAENNEIANLISRIDIENKQNYKLVFESEGKVAYLGNDSDLNTKMLYTKQILDSTKDKGGEILVNMDLNNNYPIFRQNV